MRWKKSILAVIGVLSFTAGVAQRPVAEESHHRVVFENQYMRLLDLTLPAGDTTPMHKHSAASVVVFLSNSMLVIQNEGDKPAAAVVKRGATVYRGYDEKPVVHKVWTADRLPFRCLVVEIKKNPGGNRTCPSEPLEKTSLSVDNNLVKSVTLELPKGSNYSLTGKECPYLLIDVSGSVITTSRKATKTIGENAFAFLQGPAEISAQKENANIVLLQIK